ncbi:hypothetical protein NPIL_228461 [Nephila pilipes]|uniref:Uncharacterized protein n=1 Tax=Nephila pilipes TaxID=299642 RepID=A0A8X6PNM9_NEPPI|nr:hypothetical protein NPIL_228461 [Nephila pilipes]
MVLGTSGTPGALFQNNTRHSIGDVTHCHRRDSSGVRGGGSSSTPDRLVAHLSPTLYFSFGTTPHRYQSEGCCYIPPNIQESGAARLKEPLAFRIEHQMN